MSTGSLNLSGMSIDWISESGSDSDDAAGFQIRNPKPKDFTVQQKQAYSEARTHLSDRAKTLLNHLAYVRCEGTIPQGIVTGFTSEINELCTHDFASYDDDDATYELDEPHWRWNWLRIEESSLAHQQDVFNYTCKYYWDRYHHADLDDEEKVEFYYHVVEIAEEYNIGTLVAHERFPELHVKCAEVSEGSVGNGKEHELRELADRIKAQGD